MRQNWCSFVPNLEQSVKPWGYLIIAISYPITEDACEQAHSGERTYMPDRRFASASDQPKCGKKLAPVPNSEIC